MVKNNYYSKKGWHSTNEFERQRHRLAAINGRAGNIYKNGDPLLKNNYLSRKYLAEQTLVKPQVYYPSDDDIKTDVKEAIQDVESEKEEDQEDQSVDVEEDTRSLKVEQKATEALIRRIQLGDLGKNKEILLSKKQLLDEGRSAEFINKYQMALIQAESKGFLDKQDFEKIGFGELARPVRTKASEEIAQELVIAHAPYKTATERANDYEATIRARDDALKVLKQQLPIREIAQFETDVAKAGFGGMDGILPKIDLDESGHGPMNRLGVSNPFLGGDDGKIDNPLFGDGEKTNSITKFKLDFANKTVDDIWAAKDKIIKVNTDKPFNEGKKAFEIGNLPNLRNAITNLEKEKINLKDRQIMVDAHTRPIITDNEHRKDLLLGESASEYSNPLLGGGGNAADKQMKQLDKLNTVLSNIKKEMNKTDSRISELRFKENRLRSAATVKSEPLPLNIELRDAETRGMFFGNEQFKQVFSKNVTLKDDVDVKEEARNLYKKSFLGRNVK